MASLGSLALAFALAFALLPFPSSSESSFLGFGFGLEGAAFFDFSSSSSSDSLFAFFAGFFFPDASPDSLAFFVDDFFLGDDPSSTASLVLALVLVLTLALALLLAALANSRSPLASEAVSPPPSDESVSLGEPASDSDAWKSSSRAIVVSIRSSASNGISILTLFAVLVIGALAHPRNIITAPINTPHVLVVIVVLVLVIDTSDGHEQVSVWHHLVLDLDLLVLEVGLGRLVLLLVDRGECVLGPALGDDLEIEGAAGGTHVSAHTRVDDLLDVRELDQRRLFGDEEDVFFEQEEVSLDGFQVGFDACVAVAAVRCVKLAVKNRQL